jgi:hypothetical protein
MPIETKAVLLAQRDAARSEVKELREELKVARAYIGQLERARDQYLAATARAGTPHAAR